MQDIPVAIIILTWNGLDYTRRCISSLRRFTQKNTYQLIIVDNGSTDGTVEYLRELPDVTLILNEENVGFVRGNNQAIERLGGNADVILLNNDTEVPHDQGAWIYHLQQTAYSSPDIGVVGCRLRQPNGYLQHAGAYMPVPTFWGQQIGSKELDINQYGYDRDVESVVFACAYIKRELIARIGSLCTDYFSYFEDTDYCLRAREAGYRTVCCGSVTLIHYENASTRENKVRHSDFFDASQATFKKKWGDALVHKYTQKVVWHSTVSRPHGYAMTSKDILLGLDASNIEVTYRYLYGKGTVFPVDEPDNVDYYNINTMKQRAIPADAPHVVYGQGDAFDTNTGRYKIGYTMLEVTGVPREWVRQANKMDEVWVPSTFNLNTFRASGVTVPIHIMPLGVDTNFFNPLIKRFPVTDHYTFLTVFEWGERKAPEVLLKTFNQTFSKSDPVVLLCKANVTDPSVDIQRVIADLDLSPDGGRIEFILNKYLPYHQIGSLYRSADCFVMTSRGEGWGMPILEAMACGIPVIATHWSAPTDFMTYQNAYPLRTRGVIDAVAKCPYYKGFQWADPDPSHLSHLLRHVYENPDEAREKGAVAAENVREKWSVDACVSRIVTRLTHIQEERESPSSHATTAVSSPAPSAPEHTPIALDVSRAIGEQITGIGRYTRNMVQALSQYAPEEMQFLLLPGFVSFVHPEYGKKYTFPCPSGSSWRMYDSTLPAYASDGCDMEPVSLIHSTGWETTMNTRVPQLVTIYDLSFITHPHFHTEENRTFCTRALETAITKGVSFTAISSHTKDDMVRLFTIDPDQITVVPCTYDESLFHLYNDEEIARVRKKYDLPEDYFLFLASHEPRKNLDAVLRAATEETLPAPVVVAGAHGWLHGDLLVRMTAAGRRVISLGYVDDAHLGPLYAGACALVYPSLYEGFGLPVLEAMACGTPAIASRIASLPEVVGDAGILIDDPTDHVTLAAEMTRLYTEKSLRASLHDTGLVHARRFSQKNIAAQISSLYRRLQEDTYGTLT